MDEDGFWEIVQRAHDLSGGDMDQKCDALRQLIPALSKDEALAFAQHFDAMMDKAYNWPLWGAAYVINGGCGDDTLLRLSRRVDFPGTPGLRARACRSGFAGGRGLRRIRRGRRRQINMPSPMAVEAVAGSSPPRVCAPAQPSGTEWQEDRVYDLFPKLAAKFG